MVFGIELGFSCLLFLAFLPGWHLPRGGPFFALMQKLTGPPGGKKVNRAAGRAVQKITKIQGSALAVLYAKKFNITFYLFMNFS